MAALLAAGASTVNGIAIDTGYTNQWIYIAKDDTRDPDLHNPTSVNSAVQCPTASAPNGAFNPQPALECLTNEEDGNLYAVYADRQIKRQDSYSSCNVGAGSLTCKGPRITKGAIQQDGNITAQECVDEIQKNPGMYSATYHYEKVNEMYCQLYKKEWSYLPTNMNDKMYVDLTDTYEYDDQTPPEIVDITPADKYKAIFKLPSNPNDRCRYKDTCSQTKKHICMPNQGQSGKEVVPCFDINNDREALIDYLDPDAVGCMEMNEICAERTDQATCATKIYPSAAPYDQQWGRLGKAVYLADINVCPTEYAKGSTNPNFCVTDSTSQYWKKTEDYEIIGHLTGFQDGSVKKENFSYLQCIDQCRIVPQCFAAVYTKIYDTSETATNPPAQLLTSGDCELKNKNFQMMYEAKSPTGEEIKQLGSINSQKDVYERIVLGNESYESGMGGAFGKDVDCEWIEPKISPEDDASDTCTHNENVDFEDYTQATHLACSLNIDRATCEAQDAQPTTTSGSANKCQWLEFFQEPLFTESPNSKYANQCTHLDLEADKKDKKKATTCKGLINEGPACVANGCLYGSSCSLVKTGHTYTIQC